MEGKLNHLTDGELHDLVADYTPQPAPMGRCRLLLSNGDASVVEALEELLRLRTVLAAIRDTCGQVCGDFETCKHLSCGSSYRAWSLAEEALLDREALAARELELADEAIGRD